MRARPAPAALVLVAALAGSAAHSAGQTTDSIPPLSAPNEGGHFFVQLRIGGAHLANFFQAPPGEPQRNVQTGIGEVRLSRILVGSNLELLGGMGGTLYSEFDPGWSLFTGARWGTGVQRMDCNLSFRGRSPRMEVGDTLGFADVAAASASYAVRPVGAIQLRVLTELDRQSYHRSTERNNRSLQVGGAVRYYGFGYGFSPEAGMAVGSRDVSLDEEDHDERVLWVTIRSSLASEVYLSLRYRNRSREYTVRDAASRNLDRRDTRQDLTLTVDLDLGERWAWTVYLSHQDADSTIESRIFRTQYLSTGLTYRLR